MNQTRLTILQFSRFYGNFNKSLLIGMSTIVLQKKRKKCMSLYVFSYVSNKQYNTKKKRQSHINM